MAFRLRLRAILLPALFYGVLGCASAYMVWGAQNGERGLKAKAAFAEQTQSLQAELDTLRSERKRWTRRAAAMRSESVDRDLLDEEARAVLDRVGKNDVMILTSNARK